MSRKRSQEEHHATGSIIHDNFDGSAHCVECDGECKLTGAAKIATELVRWQFEQMAIQRGGIFLNMMMESTLKRAGVDIEWFKQRAVESNRCDG